MHTPRRKKLMLGDDGGKEPARGRGTSAYEPARDTVDYALAAAKIMGSVRAIHALGGIDGVLGKLPADDGGDVTPASR